MANIHDITRDEWMLRGPLAGKGYDWWWHSMTAENEKTGEKKAFYVEFFTCNPGLAKDEPVIVWNDPEKQKKGIRPSYLMVNAGFWGEATASSTDSFPYGIRIFSRMRLIASRQQTACAVRLTLREVLM